VITNEMTLGIAMQGQYNSVVLKPNVHKYSTERMIFFLQTSV